MLAEQLADQGYRVAEAEDGEEAVRLARRLRPDIVLLDVEMPLLDGYGVLRSLKMDPGLSDTPVVFLTARVSGDDVARGLSMGAHDYLRKPFESSELLARVSAAIRVKLLQDELRRRNEELDRSARIDVLTGLYNRRQLDHEMHKLFSAALRRGEAMGMLMVDIDHFKDINDHRGHGIGDTVLQIVAARLQLTLRAEDVVGRWGGEEFLVLLASPHEGAIAEVGERLRAAVGGTPVIVDRAPVWGRPAEKGATSVASEPITVTVSVGGAWGRERTPDVLLRRADAAMYDAKAAGRNRVVVR